MFPRRERRGHARTPASSAGRWSRFVTVAYVCVRRTGGAGNFDLSQRRYERFRPSLRPQGQRGLLLGQAAVAELLRLRRWPPLNVGCD